MFESSELQLTREYKKAYGESHGIKNKEDIVNALVSEHAKEVGVVDVEDDSFLSKLGLGHQDFNSWLYKRAYAWKYYGDNSKIYELATDYAFGWTSTNVEEDKKSVEKGKIWESVFSSFDGNPVKFIQFTLKAAELWLWRAVGNPSNNSFFRGVGFVLACVSSIVTKLTYPVFSPINFLRSIVAWAKGSSEHKSSTYTMSKALVLDPKEVIKIAKANGKKSAEITEEKENKMLEAAIEQIADQETRPRDIDQEVGSEYLQAMRIDSDEDDIDDKLTKSSNGRNFSRASSQTEDTEWEESDLESEDENDQNIRFKK